MTDKLQVYNGALLHLGSRTLATLTEERKSRRVLDSIWAAGAIRYCLEQGYWNFATRTIKLQNTPSVEPDFGYKYAFQKPEDIVQLTSISTDELMRTPLNDFTDESGYWFCNYDTIYLSYVSDDAQYGGLIGNWTEVFTRFVELYLAYRAAPQITHDDRTTADIKVKIDLAMMTAKNKDAIGQGSKPKPMGRLASARMGNGYYRGNFKHGS